MTRLKHLFQSAKISMATTCVGVGVVWEEEKVQKEQRNNLLALFFVQFLFLCHTAIFTLFEKSIWLKFSGWTLAIQRGIETFYDNVGLCYWVLLTLPANAPPPLHPRPHS